MDPCGPEPCGLSALQRPAAELTVLDVYDIAAVLGQDFERIIDRFGSCEAVAGLVPKVVRVLEQLEALVSRGAAGHEAEELRRELDSLRRERTDRTEQERRHHKELEQVEESWRAEVQELLSQISELQAENKRLLMSLSLRERPLTDQPHTHTGMSEKEQQVVKKLEKLLEKQKDEIRAKDHEISLRNEDVEALQMQQQRVIRINQNLRHRVGAMEAQGKVMIQRRAELRAAAQARQQEVRALELEVSRLRKELQDWELEREMVQIEESSIPRPTQRTSSPDAVKPDSIWAECGGDPGFRANCFEQEKNPPVPQRTSTRQDEEEELEAPWSQSVSEEEPQGEEPQGEEPQEEEPQEEEPQFTLQELRDVLQERNHLKNQVFLLQEELLYYKSDDSDSDSGSFVCAPPPPPPPAPPPPPPAPSSSSSDQPESGIRRLIFTAIMPMVAAGLITDDPSLMPIRRLSFV